MSTSGGTKGEEDSIIPAQGAISAQHGEHSVEYPTNTLPASAPQVFVPKVVQVNIPLPPPLDKVNLSEEIQKSVGQLQHCFAFEKRNQRAQTATLLTCIGLDALQIYDGLDFATEEEKTNINVVLKKFQTYCAGVTNEIII